ncbi:MAG: ABC transporter permease [Coriobacteriia bacterium]
MRHLRRWLPVAAGLAGYFLLVSRMDWWESALSAVFPDRGHVLYPRATLLQFTGEHLALVAVSSAFTIAIGLPLGIWVTRRSGRAFRSLVVTGVDVGQTFPPVAVLALAMPLMGFGFWPTIVALVLYGLFPVVSNTVAGLEAVPDDVREAARGMGMSSTQMLVRVELPLAARVIMAGVRTSVIINIGTATIGAAIGAGGLGDPIIVGLVTRNMAYVLEGAIPAALLAVVADAALGALEKELSLEGRAVLAA